ncbi:N-acetyltransferase [Gramella lutea]|uniref:N-acetyltransferase n=1 Tax=Christiangramia lutea TaxID=1607951 RepID=A0A9X1V660_9FLAO|nr:N-acetyltransferase [Christiangramia lutea]MCH4824391.1 N-acetyltransferase [Christiangramia lutea]
MQVTIRKEQQKDHQEVFDLIKKAFETEKYSDHMEHYLVERLRKSASFVPELSLVAEIRNKIVGQILLTRVKIKNREQEFHSLALAPVSVLPEFQGKGIGSKLIEYAHQKARDIGFSSVLVLGHEKYYPQFGYEQAEKYGINFPFEVPKENCMCIELINNGLKGISGTVEYPKEFHL